MGNDVLCRFRSYLEYGVIRTVVYGVFRMICMWSSLYMSGNLSENIACIEKCFSEKIWHKWHKSHNGLVYSVLKTGRYMSHLRKIQPICQPKKIGTWCRYRKYTLYKFQAIYTKAWNNWYQNQKQLIPEPKTVDTRTRNECYQNQKRVLPEPKTSTTCHVAYKKRNTYNCFKRIYCCFATHFCRFA